MGTLEGLGEAPVDLGLFDLKPVEHMLFLYLPIWMPDEQVCHIPRNLHFIDPIISAMGKDAMTVLGDDFLLTHHVYVTAKTQWVSSTSPGNRPGWHVDGFGSNGDLNYIWADMNPTQFAIQHFLGVSDDDTQSMVDMTAQIKNPFVETYPDKTLLRLNECVVHRVNPQGEAGVRTFIKVTVSKHQFRNQWNSHNHAFDYSWEMNPRTLERNLDHGGN